MKASEFPMLPESELLIWCARMVVTEELAADIRQRVQGPLDWDGLIDLACYHGVVPLLHRNLSTLCADLVPVESLTLLCRRTHAGTLLNQLLAHELTVLCEAFEAHRIPVIPIKGASLAASVYGDLTLRSFSDIDLIVPEGSITEAQAVLMDLGYESEIPSLDRSQKDHKKDPHHVFLKKQTLFRVDLQYMMARQQFAFGLDRPEFWLNRRPVMVANKTVQVLAPEDLLVILCVHGSKHVWEQLKWVCDVAELLRVHQHLDWERIFKNTSTWHCQRLVYMGLSLAHLLLDAPVPERVLARFSTDSDVQMLSRRIPFTLLADHHAGVKENQAVALYFSLKDSWLERWKFGLMLCRDKDPLVTTPPAWFRWRTSLSCLARFVFLFHRTMKRLLPSRIQRAINRFVEQSG